MRRLAWLTALVLGSALCCGAVVNPQPSQSGEELQQTNHPAGLHGGTLIVAQTVNLEEVYLRSEFAGAGR